MGIVEELGSGTKKMFKYTPLFSDGKEPMIEEQDVYRITIPYAGITDNNGQETDKNRHETGNNRQWTESIGIIEWRYSSIGGFDGGLWL